MRVTICGGGLQGLELAYLAALKGWPATVIDQNPQAPARGLASSFINLGLRDLAQCDELFKDADLIIPACENETTLKLLTLWGESRNRPVAFHWPAYEISSSKLKSKQLFYQRNIPTSADWPQGHYPFILKPEVGSGSRGVRIVNSEPELLSCFGGSGPQAGWIVEEYNQGPSYSLEITGSPGAYETWEVTELFIDEAFDCRRVSAPAGLRSDQEAEFRAMALHLAESLGLVGLMDVEVILSPTGFKVLEIDARFPSQTPSAVYWATGINLLEVLANCFGFRERIKGFKQKKAVIYEHLKVDDGVISYQGEHMVSCAGPLKRFPGLWGATEVLTNYEPASANWTATLISAADTMEQVKSKRTAVIKTIKNIILNNKLKNYN